MSAAEITALATGIPAIIAAVTGLITALRAGNKASNAIGAANHANAAVTAHITNEHNAYPLNPPEATQ